MQAVLVLVLPEIPDDAEGEPLVAQLSAVSQALRIPEMKDGRMIVAIKETAKEVLHVVEP